MAPPDLEVLERIQRRVLWLSAWMVHHANTARAVDGLKVGGHQASSASSVSLLTALYFATLRPTDVVAVKAHASPAFYAIQYLRGRLGVEDLQALRTFGGLQAYPSRRKNPGVVDLSTGSMGLGAVAATFGGLATRYLLDHGGRRHARALRRDGGRRRARRGQRLGGAGRRGRPAARQRAVDRRRQSPEPRPRRARRAARAARRDVSRERLASGGAALGPAAARACSRDRAASGCAPDWRRCRTSSTSGCCACRPAACARR